MNTVEGKVVQDPDQKMVSIDLGRESKCLLSVLRRETIEITK